MSTKEVGIYLINKGKFDSNLSNEEIIKELKNIFGNKYNSIKIGEDCINNYNVKLYNKVTTSKDTWSEFWNCLDNGEKIADSGMLSNNYIAFIYKDNNIFCITTNKAYHDITKYIVSFFGVCVMSYFIQDDDKIRSASYNNIMSNFLGGSEYLGEEYQATIDKYWDRINTSLMAELNKERVYRELGLESKRKHPKIRFDAKDNFTICSKLTLKEIVQVIEKLDSIANSDLIDKFNTIESVKDEVLKEKLEEELITKMFNDYIEDKLDISLVHKNMEKYFGSMSYTFNCKGTYKHECLSIPDNADFKTVLDELEVDSVEKMKKVLKELRLICFDSDGKTELSDNVKVFLNANVEYKGENYLLKNKSWYKLSDNYIKNLDQMFKFVKNNFKEESLKLKSWGKGTEENYINLYTGEPNFYKLHPKTDNGIEVCDLLYIDRKNLEVKMLFLKDGFGANTRDLAIQVIMGTKRLLSIINEEKSLKKFYKKYIEPKTPEYTYGEFKSEIKEFSKKSIMVYRLPKSNKEKSNIGKQSVIYAKNEIEMLSRCKFSIKRL